MPDQAVPQYPIRKTSDPISQLEDVSATINQAQSPLFILGEKRVLVPQMNEGILGKHNEEGANLRTKLGTILLYLGLGVERATTFRSIQQALDIDNPRILISDRAQNIDVYIAALKEELEALEKGVRLIPLASAPIWAVIDQLSIGLMSPPLTETIIGTAATYGVVKMWVAKIKGLRKALEAGLVEFDRDPYITSLEENFSLETVDDIDGVPQNGLYHPRYINGARVLVARADEGPKDRARKVRNHIKEAAVKAFSRNRDGKSELCST